MIIYEHLYNFLLVVGLFMLAPMSALFLMVKFGEKLKE